MNEKEILKEFDEKFKYIGAYSKSKEIKSFLTSALASQREGIERKIEEAIKAESNLEILTGLSHALNLIKAPKNI